MKNPTTIFVAILFVLFILASCGQNDNKQKELEIKERELALKEKEFYLDSIQKSKKIETTTSISNSVNPISQPSKDVAPKSNPKQDTGDKDKFIGTFTWHGECPQGCGYTHIFKQNGTVKTTFETAGSSETYSENWTVNENSKVITMDKVKYFYKFNRDNIILTSCQYPDDIHELSREK